MNDRLRRTAARCVNESGIEIKPLYTAADVAASGGVDDARRSRASTRSRAASIR